MQQSRLINIFGWYGMLALLCAYFLVSTSILSAHSVGYHALNVTGALGIALISARQKAWPPAILNAIWVCIGLFTILWILW